MRLPSPRRAGVAAALAALVAVLAPAGAASAAQDAFTPILQTPVAPPQPVLGSDGRYHLVYEVQAVNASGLPFTVRSVAVRANGARGRVLARWSGATVATVLQSFAGKKPIGKLDPGEAALFYLTFSVAARSSVPSTLVQQLSLANASRPVVGPPRVTEASAPMPVSRQAPTKLGPPLEGDRWVAADGCCTAHRHVRATVPYGGRLYGAQRFAVDWEKLDDQGRLWTGDEHDLHNWTGYGQRVLAVGDGTIVHAVNDLPNQVPGELPAGLSPDKADGNGVFLRLRDGRYVFYGHMIPGSVTVQAGDDVTRGQVLGLVGNSGNSSAPHLHLHMMDANAIFAANGLPYVFDRFTVTAKVASTDAFNKAEATGQPAQLGPVRLGPRQDELPLDQVVVKWG
jgi:Peptidase family M23